MTNFFVVDYKSDYQILPKCSYWIWHWHGFGNDDICFNTFHYQRAVLLFFMECINTSTNVCLVKRGNGSRFWFFCDVLTLPSHNLSHDRFDFSYGMWCGQILHQNGSNLLFHSKMVWNFNFHFGANNCANANSYLLEWPSIKWHPFKWKVFFALENFVCSKSNSLNEFLFWVFSKIFFFWIPI